jgi:transposase-like protein
MLFISTVGTGDPIRPAEGRHGINAELLIAVFDNGVYILDTQAKIWQNKTMNKPKTLQQAIVYFSDPQRAFEYAVSLRWPDGKVTCPRCSGSKHSFIKTRRIWFCYDCNKQFTLKIGTVFEDSPIGLDKWMAAFWMMVNCKNGISSMEIHRAIGVTQKTAWFMLQRLRLAVQGTISGKLSGHVEVDETFIGGKARFMHKNKREKVAKRGASGKAIVVGVLERGGKVRAEVVENRERANVQAVVKQHVEPGSQLSTDEWSAYFGLSPEYAHKIINHAEAYVDGQVHTNGLENFWSLLKRGLKGTTFPWNRSIFSVTLMSKFSVTTIAQLKSTS